MNMNITDNEHGDDDEWEDKAIRKGSDKKDQLDPEILYANDIRQYDSDASENRDYKEDESDDSDDSDDNNESDDSDDNDYNDWASKQLNKRKRIKNDKKNKKNKKSKRRTNKSRCRHRFNQMKPLPMPDDHQKQQILNSITSADFSPIGHYEGIGSWSEAEIILNKFIQCTLWDANFRYTLLLHQFSAVLAVAGLDVNALLDQLSQLQDDYNLIIDLGKKGRYFRKQLCIHNIFFVSNQGCLLADVMGLGKTVSSLAGAILRNYITKLKSKDAKSLKTESKPKPKRKQRNDEKLPKQESSEDSKIGKVDLDMDTCVDFEYSNKNLDMIAKLPTLIIGELNGLF